MTDGTTCVVNSWNEWDPLEEVIVGVLDGAPVEEPLELPMLAVAPKDILARLTEIDYRIKMATTGIPVTQHPEYELIKKELEEFVRVLEGEGVKVRRPDPIVTTRGYSTPDWTCVSGRGQTVPRDVIIVIGNEIIEASMSWRNRYFEFLAYRNLIREYFEKGAKWSAAPKPRMTNDLYNAAFQRGKEYFLTEAEPVFEAADIARFGKDLVVQRSHLTNEAGIEWLRRHLGPTFNIHVLYSEIESANHINATLVPLAPGKVMISPARVSRDTIPEIFRKGGWDILEAVPSVSTEYHLQWESLNVLSLDEKRVIVEKSEEAFIRQLKNWGFTPIPVAFRHFYPFGGSFHNATCDVRRRGTLQSYF